MSAAYRTRDDAVNTALALVPVVLVHNDLPRGLTHQSDDLTCPCMPTLITGEPRWTEPPT